jgi:ADP-ribose pyrophosphatase YjhB (NUDIX family)
LTEVLDSPFMEQKYKIFYRRHHFVFDQNTNIEGVSLVIKHVDKELLKAVLTYLKECDNPRTIQVSEPNGFDNFLACFKLIYAAGGAVYNTDEHLLLMKRKGVWDLPKGKLDKGESIVNAAVREVEEECNVFGIEVNHKIGLTYHIYFEKKWLLKETHWYNMHSAEWQDAKPQVEEEIEEIKWVNRALLDLDNLDTYQNIKYVLEKL